MPPAGYPHEKLLPTVSSNRRHLLEKDWKFFLWPHIRTIDLRPTSRRSLGVDQVAGKNRIDLFFVYFKSHYPRNS